MVITYSGKSKPSAVKIAEYLAGIGDDVRLHRNGYGDINWGRARANTRLNPDITNTTNKRRMRELFKEHGVPMPKLLYPSDYDMNFVNTELAHGKAVVGRPDCHTRGRGFWLCKSYDDVVRALRGTRKKKAATHFMEYIDAPHEYRVHIFNGKSIRISEKSFIGQEGSHKEYVTIKPTGNTKHVRKAAKAAVAALGLDFGAADILASEDKCWVLEVNAAPGLGGSMPRVYGEAFRKWKEECDG